MQQLQSTVTSGYQGNTESRYWWLMVGNQGKRQECEALVKSAKSERWDGRREPRKKDQLRQRHRVNMVRSMKFIYLTNIY